jgi:Cu(I)/Ag(I) efflux system membrane fusion protein
MKTRISIFIFLLAAVLGFSGCSKSGNTQSSSTRKIKFYQCSMHPQVKSDKPEKCTICGMDLTPIFEGETALNENVITLSSGAVNVINVQVEPVKRHALRRTIRVAGTIEDDDSRHRIIAAYIDGRIDKLFVNFVGAEVKQGEPLAAFYSPALLSTEREYLVTLQHLPTNAAPIVHDEHKRLVEMAAQKLKRLGLTEEQVETLPQNTNALLQTRIVAPMSGTVVARHVYEGQYVKEGDKLFEIGDFSVMWFQFDAYERDLPWLHVGQEIQVTTPSVPGKTYAAKISFLDPNLNDPTRSAKVRVEIANPVVKRDGKTTRELFHRLYGEGLAQVESSPVLAIPRGAVLNPDGKPLVYVEASAGSYEPRNVQLGRFGDDIWEVIEGVAEGEKVVTQGNLLIDAQAQLNRGASSDVERKEKLSGTNRIDVLRGGEKLTEAQMKAVDEFLSVSAALSAALAADDLNRFNEQADKLDIALGSLTNTLGLHKSWQSRVGPIVRSPMHRAADLAEARKAFVPFSAAVVELAKGMRILEFAFRDIRIFRCPMASEAVPDAPKNGFWIQRGLPLRNPFFGKAMLDCGTEVRQ